MPLEAVAREIVHRSDYSLRDVQTPQDDIGVVIAAINRMLDEGQARTQALERANASLTEQNETRRIAEDALAAANDRLENTMSASEIGTWLLDLRTHQVVADLNLARLCGYDDASALSGDPSLLHQVIHPDDREAVRCAETEALRSGILALDEFRLVRADGSQRWVTGRGRVRYDTAGQPATLPCLVMDIGARKHAEQALRTSERIYRAIGESMDFGIWICDPVGRTMYASNSFLQLTGLTDLTGAQVREFRLGGRATSRRRRGDDRGMEPLRRKPYAVVPRAPLPRRRRVLPPGAEQGGPGIR